MRSDEGNLELFSLEGSTSMENGLEPEFTPRSNKIVCPRISLASHYLLVRAADDRSLSRDALGDTLDCGLL